MSTGRRGALRAAWALITLPAALTAVEAARFITATRPTATFVSSGKEREYVLHVPERYDPTRPSPLVISLHGASLDGAAQRAISHWDRVADDAGFIVVYPTAEGGRGPRVWHQEDPAESRFIAELIDTIAAHYNIDRARIYVNGFSNGGGMAFTLSCTLADRIAAVGMVGAAQLEPWTSCHEPRPLPMIAFHGTADKQALFHGGKAWFIPQPLPDQLVWTGEWARRNACRAPMIETKVAPDVARRFYGQCANDASVELFILDGGGHTWPGGGPLPEWFAGPTNTSVDASVLMWEFFRAHPLR